MPVASVHAVPEVLAQEPDSEIIVRAIVAVLLNGDADENKLVVKRAMRYIEYTLLLQDWEAHPIKSDFTVDLSTIQTRAE